VCYKLTSMPGVVIWQNIRLQDLSSKLFCEVSLKGLESVGMLEKKLLFFSIFFARCLFRGPLKAWVCFEKLL
jgi:hypothetical protein